TDLIRQKNAELDQQAERIWQLEQEQSSHQRTQDELNQQQNTRKQAEKEKDNKEAAIIEELNNQLKLNLANPTLAQVIKRIQELIQQPPITIPVEIIRKELEQAQATIIRLEKELTAKPNET